MDEGIIGRNWILASLRYGLCKYLEDEATVKNLIRMTISNITLEDKTLQIHKLPMHTHVNSITSFLTLSTTFLVHELHISLTFDTIFDSKLMPYKHITNFQRAVYIVEDAGTQLSRQCYKKKVNCPRRETYPVW